MKALTDTVVRLAALPWLMGAVAVVLAAVLLAVFVDAVHENTRRGEAFRQAQHAGGAGTGHAALAVEARAGQAPLR